jgi:hypothetical protein
MGADVIRFDDIRQPDNDALADHEDGRSIYWAGLNRASAGSGPICTTLGRELLTALITSPGEGEHYHQHAGAAGRHEGTGEARRPDHPQYRGRARRSAHVDTR